jgi:SAM-dependent methyltransferase
MIGFFELLKDRFKKDELYDKSEYWDKKATRYRGLARSMWPSRHFNECLHEAQKKEIQRLASTIKGKRVLDMGCGTGRLSVVFAELGAVVKGIDFSPASVKAATEELPEEFRSRVRYAVVDFTKKGEEEHFDLVFCAGVLSLACNSQEAFETAIQKVCECTKTGGKILLIEPIHKVWFLRRICGYGLDRWMDMFKRNGVRLSHQGGLAFFPFRYLLAFINLPPRFVRVLFWSGEWLLKLPFMRPLSDYKVLLFVKE